MKKLTKKKNRFKVFLEESENIQTFLILFGMTLFFVLDYWVTKWEFSLLPLNNIDGQKINWGTMDDYFIFMMFNFAIICSLHALLTSSIPRGIRKLKARQNYRHIPLTEDSVHSFGFASAGEYFNYVSQLLYYGDKDQEEEKGQKTNYIQLKWTDLQKMLAVCLKVFPDNGTIFTIKHTDCEYICSNLKEFVQFLDFYHVSYENNEKYSPSANINKEGIVILSVLNKDGRGAIWNGESFLLQHFSKDAAYSFGIETVALHAFAELLFLDANQSFISYRALKRYGEEVERILKEKEIPAAFTLSRVDIDLMLRGYSGFFTEATINGENGLLLSDRQNYDDMINLLVILCKYMPDLILTAFSNKQAVRLLFNE